MSVRTRDWLKFGALVAIAFIFGLAFASTLGLPKAGGLPESVAAAPAPTPSELGAQGSAPRTPVVVPKAVADLGDAFVSIADHVKPAVVFIKSQHVERADNQRLPPGFEDFFPQFRRRPQVEQGSGSGFIVSADGYILTNNHVVAGADKVTVKLYDKREFTAKVVGTDPNTDVAVIKIETRGLPTAQFGNSDSTRVGEWALAIGNPLGEAFAFTVTAGIVSAKGRLLQGLQQSRYAIQDFIQTDAAINPGNSGGPLVNIRGQVIGINSAIASETGFYAGYGFAIPINLARTVMDQLVKSGHVERAVMGIGIVDADENDAAAVGLKQITGVVVKSYTDDNSPAKKAGIQLGDVIVALDGESIDNTPQLQQKVAFKKPGETVEITVLRQGGEKRTVTVRLARAPSEADSEVAAASSKAKGEAASSKEEMLGIARPAAPAGGAARRRADRDGRLARRPRVPAPAGRRRRRSGHHRRGERRAHADARRAPGSAAQGEARRGRDAPGVAPHPRHRGRLGGDGRAAAGALAAAGVVGARHAVPLQPAPEHHYRGRHLPHHGKHEGRLVGLRVFPEHEREQHPHGPGGHAAGAEPPRQHLPVQHPPAEQRGRQREREPRDALRVEHERAQHVEHEDGARGGHSCIRGGEAPRQRPPGSPHERDDEHPRRVGERGDQDAGAHRALPGRADVPPYHTDQPGERQREAEEKRPMDRRPRPGPRDRGELCRAVLAREIGMERARHDGEQ